MEALHVNFEVSAFVCGRILALFRFDGRRMSEPMMGGACVAKGRARPSISGMMADRFKRKTSFVRANDLVDESLIVSLPNLFCQTLSQPLERTSTYVELYRRRPTRFNLHFYETGNIPQQIGATHSVRDLIVQR